MGLDLTTSRSFVCVCLSLISLSLRIFSIVFFLRFSFVVCRTLQFSLVRHFRRWEERECV